LATAQPRSSTGWIVRKAGLHRLRERVDELPKLSWLATLTMGAGTADDIIETMLRHVFRSYTEGAQGTAVGILFGLELGRRGANPSVLREAAAKRLGYYSVETFRKKPEHNAIAYFADVLQRYASDTERLEVPVLAVLKVGLPDGQDHHRRGTVSRSTSAPTPY
jgi:hypothetical protein